MGLWDPTLKNRSGVPIECANPAHSDGNACSIQQYINTFDLTICGAIAHSILLKSGRSFELRFFRAGPPNRCRKAPSLGQRIYGAFSEDCYFRPRTSWQNPIIGPGRELTLELRSFTFSCPGIMHESNSTCCQNGSSQFADI